MKICFVGFTSTNIRYCSKLLSCAISRKTNELNLRKWQKKLVLGPILAPLLQIQVANFFSKIWLRQSLGSQLSCANQKKTNDPVLRKFTDRRTDGQTDESDFMGRRPTNVECPKLSEVFMC